MFCQDALVAVMKPQFPRNGDAGCSPKETTEAASDGCHVGEASVFLLKVAHCLKVLAKKLLAIPKVGGGMCKHVDVAAPSHALITLWTVGGQGDEVAKRRPFYVFP